MARAERLSTARAPRPSGRRGTFGRRSLGALVVAVLLAHVLVIEWFGRELGQRPSALRRMAEPMYTRVLEPAAPPEPPAQVARAPAPAPPKRPAITQMPEAAHAAAQPASAPASAALPVADPDPPTVQAEPVEAQAPPPPPQAEPVEAQAPPPPLQAEPVEAQAPPPPAQAEPVEAPPAITAASGTTSPSTSEAADRWPRDTRLRYAVTGHFRGPLYGNAQVLWQREGTRYQVSVIVEVTLAGTRVMTSQGEVTAAGLRPKVYEEVRGSRRRSVRMDGAQLVFENGSTAPKPEDVQDTASQFVELAWRFANGVEPLRLGHPVQLWLARPGGLDLWTYDVVKEELLVTPRHGEIAAFRLKPRPLPNARGNITAEIWFAPTLQYLPVRIRIAMGDEAWVDLMVDVVEQR